jgi:hypothetical protein
MTEPVTLPAPFARRRLTGTGASWSNAKRWAAYTVVVDQALYNSWDTERVRVYPPSSTDAWLQWDVSVEGMMSGRPDFRVMGEFRRSDIAEQALKELASGVALLTKAMKRPGRAKGWTVKEDPAASWEAARALLAEKGVHDPTNEQLVAQMAISFRTFERYRAAGKLPRR